jgi:hypothetical protein
MSEMDGPPGLGRNCTASLARNSKTTHAALELNAVILFRVCSYAIAMDLMKLYEKSEDNGKEYLPVLVFNNISTVAPESVNEDIQDSVAHLNNEHFEKFPLDSRRPETNAYEVSVGVALQNEMTGQCRVATSRPHQKQIFVGKLDMSCRQAKDFVSCYWDGDCRGGAGRGEGFWAAQLVRPKGRLPSSIRLFAISVHLYSSAPHLS